MRRAGIALAAALALLPASASPARAQSAPPAREAGPEQDFRRFVESLWPEARAAGIVRTTFDDALRGLVPDEKVVALTRKQGEFSRPISAYVTGAVSTARVSQGKVLAERWRAALDGVERTYGVPRSVVLAIWASESGYGASTGGFDIVRALATLAFVTERKEFFRRELIAALKILQDDGIARSDLKGSWAGAMGQPQFMPSSFLARAVDGDGDGRRDIWRSVPDVLASIGHFLAQSGWKADLPWGLEARLPGGIDLSVHERDLAEWGRLGVARANGRPLPRAGRGRLFLPAGIEGPAFVVTDNWEAIRAYNTSMPMRWRSGSCPTALRAAQPCRARGPRHPFSAATSGARSIGG
jgi:lytic murein transglycosylase